VKTKSPLKISNLLGLSHFCKLQVVHLHLSITRNTDSNQFQQANHVIRGEFIRDLLASFTLATLMVKTFLGNSLGTTKAPRDGRFLGLSTTTCAITEMESNMNLRQQSHSKETREI
jgi:hypothetical protein